MIKDTKLFVVGDLKQSIYRFRGATISAFDLIRTDKEKWEEFSLTINYRTCLLYTSSQLLLDMYNHAGNMDKYILQVLGEGDTV